VWSSGLIVGIDKGLYVESGTVGLVWGLIQGYVECGSGISLGIDTGLWGESRAVGLVCV